MPGLQQHMSKSGEKQLDFPYTHLWAAVPSPGSFTVSHARVSTVFVGEGPMPSHTQGLQHRTFSSKPENLASLICVSPARIHPQMGVGEVRVTFLPTMQYMLEETYSHQSMSEDTG